MTIQIADRVVETTATEGTGTYTLAGAKAGYRSFAAAVTAGDIADGDTVYYYATDSTDWEVGSGVFTVATLTLTRATIARSSNAGSAVNWAAGSKDVVCNMPAAELQKLIDNSFGPTTITAGTLTTNVKTLDLSAAWNNAGVTFTGIKFNATDTASAAASLLMDLQVDAKTALKLGTDRKLYFGDYGTIRTGFATIGYNQNGAQLVLSAGLHITGTLTTTANIAYANGYASLLGGSGATETKWLQQSTVTGRMVIEPGAANGVLEIRNSTNAQTFNLYGHYVSATSYSRLAVKHAVTTLASVSGATVTATGLIPAKANVLGINTKIMVALGTGSGTTGYAVGDGTDPNRWGDVVGTATTVSSAQADATADPTGWFNAANDVVITAAGGNFDGTGSILIDVAYTMTEAD